MTDETLDREAVARIVDPDKWCLHDRHGADCTYESLAKADEILRLIALARASVPEEDQEVSSSVAESAAVPKSSAPDAASSLDDERFWLVLHEPGNVPQRKGPWPRSEIKAVLREFMAARPTAYIDVLTLEHDGPNVRHGPEVLQILDGRSMGVGRRHNAQTRAAHAEAHAAIARTQP